MELKDSPEDPPKVSGYEYHHACVFFPSNHYLLMCYWGVNGELYLFSVGVLPEKFKGGKQEQENNYTYREETIMMECGF